MTIYTGTAKDGSDMREVTGVYLSPDGKYFSNKPYTEKNLNEDNVWKIIYEHISGKRTLREEFDLIKSKKSELPKKCRDYVVKVFKDEYNSLPINIR
jgi:hypothetical protein